MWELHHSTTAIAKSPRTNWSGCRSFGPGSGSTGRTADWNWLESRMNPPIFWSCDAAIRRIYEPIKNPQIPWILLLVWSLFCLCSRSTYGEPYMFRFSMVRMPPRWGLTGWRNDVRIIYGVLTLPMVIRKGMVQLQVLHHTFVWVHFISLLIVDVWTALQSFQTLNWGDK